MDHPTESRPDDGPEAPEPLSRGDMKLFRAALRQDWPIPEPVKKRILQSLINACDPDHWEGQLAGTRTRIAAARTIAAFCSLGLAQARLDFERERLEGRSAGEKTLAECVTDAERLAEERERGRDDERIESESRSES